MDAMWNDVKVNVKNNVHVACLPTLLVCHQIKLVIVINVRSFGRMLLYVYVVGPSIQITIPWAFQITIHMTLYTHFISLSQMPMHRDLRLEVL